MTTNRARVALVLLLLTQWTPAGWGGLQVLKAQTVGVGHPNFESPQANPIGIMPDYARVYVVNTPADTVDVIDTRTATVIARINVGIDPVGIAVRPDGREVWVSNHVSDAVSVIDSNPASQTYHQVIATIQDLDPITRTTQFDEPVGVAFAGNAKAYVALSSRNLIAVVDVASRTVQRTLPITAQEPRAIAVSGNRLYVIPFESNNQSQLSGCYPENIDGDLCTFDAREHVLEADPSNAQTLSLNYVSDVVRHPGIPDRDLYVFDTRTDRLVEIVNGVGTLLYGIAVDSRGKVFVTQTDARNAANGRAGTQLHGLAELRNRAYLNQITTINCGSGQCMTPVPIDLEPTPPSNPAPGMALATPFGIRISPDDTTLVVTAEGSDKLFTVDAGTGSVLGRTSVGAVPRGIALQATNDGAPARAWVLNAVANTVSLVDLTAIDNPRVMRAVVLDDPTHPAVKAGRAAFHDANASSTGTFSCASCHPAGHMDQLIWVLDTPLCDVGCDQIQPRLTQPVRGLRDSAPYHWDGIPGDPFGGINTASIRVPVEPNCLEDVPESCTRHIVDGALRSTMCDQENCPQNEEGKDGFLSAAERDAMAMYLLSIPYPPAPGRAYTDELSNGAKEAFNQFHYVDECSNCHRPPFLLNTNMGGSGVDVPTWRGAADRWKNSPQNRFFFADLIGGDLQGYPEEQMWGLGLKWPIILEGSTGFPGAFGRQLTLNRDTAGLVQTSDLLTALENAAGDGAIVLQGDGALRGNPVSYSFTNGSYRFSGGDYRRSDLLSLARAGELVLTLTGRLGPNVDVDHPQPTLWPLEDSVMPIFSAREPVKFPELSTASQAIMIHGRHIQQSAQLFVDGRRSDGTVSCQNGVLPNCLDDVVVIQLDRLTSTGGMHFIRVQNPGGLFSNDYIFFANHVPAPSTADLNLIASGGTFRMKGQWSANTINASVSWNGQAEFHIAEALVINPWNAQLSHEVAVTSGQQYTICYDARADAERIITVDVDTAFDTYRSLMGGQKQVTLGTAVQQFRHTFAAGETDDTARIRFDMAQSVETVQLDNIGLYRGGGCHNP